MKLNNKKIGILCLVGLIFLIIASFSIVSAHQPRLASDNHSIESPIVVENPETSQAFYGELNGNPVYYKITSPQEFRLYLNILVPDVPGASTELTSFQILDGNKQEIANFNGKNNTWTSYFEEFGGDYYLKGSQYNETQKAGTYYIKIYNENNQGKYSLAVGDIEEFPVGESLNALVLLPILKANIFEIPIVELFLQFLGLIIGIGTLLTLTILILKSKKSEKVIELTKAIIKPLRIVLWLGIVLSSIMWIYNYIQDTFNILGIVTTLWLFIAIILTLVTDIKVNKMSKDNVPWIIASITLVFWVIFLLLRVILI
ncbi:MAG: hypothetical protein ACRC1M_03465 [Methanobacteriaceae archaeon]